MKKKLTTLIVILSAAFAIALDDAALLNKLTNGTEVERNDALQSLLAQASTGSIDQIAALLPGQISALSPDRLAPETTSPQPSPPEYRRRGRIRPSPLAPRLMFNCTP